MKIIYAIFAGPGIREDFGKIFSILDSLSSMQDKFDRGSSQTFFQCPEMVGTSECWARMSNSLKRILT
jgi:hypothetical protein